MRLLFKPYCVYLITLLLYRPDNQPSPHAPPMGSILKKARACVLITLGVHVSLSNCLILQRDSQTLRLFCYWMYFLIYFLSLVSSRQCTNTQDFNLINYYVTHCIAYHTSPRQGAVVYLY